MPLEEAEEELKKPQPSKWTSEQKWGVTIGLIGLILTAISIINSYMIYSFQSKNDATQISIARQNADAGAIQIFNSFLPALRSGDKKAEATYGFIAERFQNEHDNRLFAELLLHLNQQKEIELKETTVLKLSEATRPVSSKSESWIAVAHSYLAQNKKLAQRAACEVISDIEAFWPEGTLPPKVEIYLTKEGGSLAVTVGGFVTEAEARKNAKMLQDKGIKDDAFAQVNRDWEPVEVFGETLIKVLCRD